MSGAGDLLPLTSAAPLSVQAAVFIHKGQVGPHVGLAYFVSDLGEYRLLHQAWHHLTFPASKIDDHAVLAGAPLWLVSPALDEEDLVSLRSTIDRVARGLAERQLPYAFDRADASITPTGVIDLGASLGLTCATFTMLVFVAAQVELIVELTWQSDRSPQRKNEDRDFYLGLVKLLGRTDAPHADRIAKDVERVRVRPEEVAACSGCVARPVTFAAAEPLGRALLARL